MIDHHAAHQLSRYSEEVGAICPLRMSFINEAKVGLVD
jgi:hypothetical protein